MLSAMGVPARYVEGYAVGFGNIVDKDEKEDKQTNVIYSNRMNGVVETSQVTLSVKDSNAHAWVEVYIDGSGWVPVEFTPGMSNLSDSSEAGDMMIIGNNLKDGQLSGDTQNNSTAQPTNSPNNMTKNNRADKEKPVNKTDKTKEVKRQNTYTWIITTVGFVLGLTLLILHVLQKKTKRSAGNRNKKALFLYQEIEKILSICKGLPGKEVRLEDQEEYVARNCPLVDEELFTSCMETVRKARFGKKRISLEELHHVERFHRDLYKKAFHKVNVIKKLYLKLILLV
jgi:hypothetical protein